MSERSYTGLRYKLNELRKIGHVVILDCQSPDFKRLCKECNVTYTKTPHSQFYSTRHRRNVVQEWEYRLWNHITRTN
jgi:hypothetical protein